MPTYIIKVDNSDLSPHDINKQLTTGTGTDSSFNVSPANGGGLVQVALITASGVPNSDNWENGGTFSVEIEIVTGDSNIRARARVCRLNSSGTPVTLGTYTDYQTLDASRTFAPVAPTFTGEVCSDRIMIQLEVQNNAPHGNHSVDIGTGTTDNEVVSNISHDICPTKVFTTGTATGTGSSTVVIRAREATTGAATGTGSSTVIIKAREATTGTATGTGTGFAIPVIGGIVLTTGTATGSGSGTATIYARVSVTASSTGIATGNAIVILRAFFTVSTTGTGTAVCVSVIITKKHFTGSAAGTGTGFAWQENRNRTNSVSRETRGQTHVRGISGDAEIQETGTMLNVPTRQTGTRVATKQGKSYI